MVAVLLVGFAAAPIAAGATAGGSASSVRAAPAISALAGDRPDERRTIRVRIAYSPSVRGVPFWKSQIERALERAEDLLRDDLGLDFELADVVEWPAGEHGGPLKILVADLVATVRDGGADVVLGLAATGDYDPDVDGFVRARRFETRGLTNYVRGYAVVRLEGPIERAGRLVAHELAHVFGAVHVEGSGLMGADSTGTRIDPLNRELLHLHRVRSFGPSRHPLDRSRWTAARRLFEKAREAADADERTRIDLQLAELEMASGRWERAAELLAEATGSRPDHPTAWSKLGYASLQAGDLETAERAIRRALELRPESYWNRINLGVVLDARGELEAAVEQLEGATRTRPDVPDAYENLGHVLASAGRYREAGEAYLRVLELAPDRAVMHREVARAYFHQGRFEEAAEEVGRALYRGVPVDRRLVEEIEEVLGRRVEVEPDDSGAPEGGTRGRRPSPRDAAAPEGPRARP